MPFDLSGKIAAVTGGGSGIGESICKVFARAGATVCILDLRPEEAQQVATQIIADGGTAYAFQADVSQQTEMIAVCEKIAGQFGRLDIMVNNAGIAHVGKLLTTSEADLDRIYSVNIKGVYNGMYAAIPHMMTQRSGVILNMSSIAAMVGLPDRFAYSMSKGAVTSMTLTTARDYLEFNIRCNCIAPARIHTPFVDGFLAKNYPGHEAEMFEKLSKIQPIGRMGTPEEVANLALFLCSEEAGYITGMNVPIDGGFINLNT